MIHQNSCHGLQSISSPAESLIVTVTVLCNL
uniref:Uncharacterized protein n=1 Tax=Anguilla anguilla TaxID=7936 RepID=A0A0E9XGB4_ANGAN